MLFLFLSALPSDPPEFGQPEFRTPDPGQPSDAPGDEEVLLLVERAKNGDEEAFESLVSQYERFVYNVACRVLSSSSQPQDMAEDIAQETFLKAWRSLSKFRGGSTFSTWLFRIAVNCAKDAVRSAARRPAASLSFAGEEDEDGTVPSPRGIPFRRTPSSGRSRSSRSGAPSNPSRTTSVRS